MTPDQYLADALHRVRAGGPVLRLGVAVSGGGDSMALLRLAADWAGAQGAELFAATVDHGLRPEAADEAQFVKTTCKALGVDHQILAWQSAPEGNVQAAARQARYDLLAEWANRMQLDAVLLGHTADDQAETFVMRLARGSGVDGLAAMQSDWRDRGQRWVRPVLGVSRSDLRDLLRAVGQGWIEDPSNQDEQFERVRIRNAMQSLTDIGLTRARLVETSYHMSRARDALSRLAHDAAREIAFVQCGEVHFNRDQFAALASETRHRLLSGAITYVASADYRPRYDALRALEHEVLSGQTRTLHGCLVSVRTQTLVIGREANAIASETALPGQLWDGRWVLESTDGFPATAIVAPLGQGILNCENWRETGVSRNALMTSPAIWADDHLIAAPMAGLGDLSLMKRTPSTEEFLSAILSH